MSLHSKLIFLLSFLFISAILNSIFIFKLKEDEKEKLKWVNHTHKVIIETKNFLSHMQDAETGQRGFLLTIDTTYLEPYNTGVINAKKHFTNLQELTSDNPKQQKRLNLIKKYMELKLTELDETIELTQNNNNNNKALEIVKQNKGKQYMDDIRDILNEFINMEMFLLKERESDFTKHSDMITNLVKLEIIFFIFLALLTLLFLNKNLFTPLKLLLSSTQKMEKGEKVNITDADIKSNNEIGYLLSSFLKMHDKVSIRTKELQNYKNELEVKVKEEIDKNTEKDKIMLAQSRHAAMGEMISMIAHQWRQPITTIAMGANNLLVDLDLNELSEENIKEESQSILKQTEYLSKTIDDFKNFFRPNKEIEEVGLEEVMDEAEKIIGKYLEDSQVTLSIKHENGYKVKTYSRELLQVYINLLKNAKEAVVENIEKNRHIDVLINSDAKNVITTICDNGGGIDKVTIKKIFDPYFSTKDEKSGTGLGLYMSKIIIEKHLHGTIEAYNTEDGACFKVAIPKEWRGGEVENE